MHICAECDDILKRLQRTLGQINNYKLKYALLRCATTISILLDLNETCYSSALCYTARMYIDVVRETLTKSPPRTMAPKTVMDRQVMQYVRLTSLLNCRHFNSIHNHVCNIPSKRLPMYTGEHVTRGFFTTMQPTLMYALRSRVKSGTTAFSSS